MRQTFSKNCLVFLLTGVMPLSAVAANVSAQAPAQRVADNARFAAQIFERLLNNNATTERVPRLEINDTPSYPTANALPNGNIAINMAAIEFCLDRGRNAGANLLAFVLAHELAHIGLSDHRVPAPVDSESPLLPAFLVGPRKADNNLAKEHSADKRALVTMELSGFNANEVITRRDFFTAWVERTVSTNCANPSNPLQQAHCSGALTRHQSLRKYRDYVAHQTNLYSIGTRRAIVGDYDLSRDLLYEFVKEIPSAYGYAQLGLTYLFEALSLIEKYDTSNNLPHYAFPLRLSLMNATLHRAKSSSSVLENFRGEDPTFPLEKRVHELIERANAHFDRAFDIKPTREFLIYKVTGLIIDERPISAKGVIAEQYVRQFGDDLSTELLYAIIAYQQNERGDALNRIQVVADKATEQDDRLMANIATWNERVMKNEIAKAHQSLVSVSFESNMDTRANSFSKISISPNRYQTGRRLTPTNQNDETALWLNGNRYFVHKRDDNVVLTDNNRVIIESTQRLREQSGSNEAITNTFGIPDRLIQTLDATYYLYEQRRSAVILAGDGHLSIINY